MLKVKEKVKATTTRHHAELLELRNTLSRSLLELRQSQQIYMPGLNPLLDDDENSGELMKLWLPSELSPDKHVVWCLPGIPNLELCFCYAQADDSLAKICRLLQLLQGVHDQNAKHLSQAQKSVTCTQDIFNSFQTRIHRTSTRYHC